MGRSIDVFLPKMLPAMVLSPNRGERREGRIPEAISNAKRDMRGEVCIGLLAHDSVREWERPAQYAHLVLTFRSMSAQRAARMKGLAGRRYRPDDTGNAVYSLKGAIDGIIDAGIIIDDSYRHMFHTCIVQRVTSVEEEGLRVQVFEVDEAPAFGE